MGAAFELAAHLGCAFGNKGEVAAYAPDGLLLVVYVGLEAYVVPPSLDAPRRLSVTKVRETDKGVFVTFAGVDDRTVAECLSGRFLLASVDSLCFEAAPVDGWIANAELEGRRVIDERFGDLGEVVEVISTPAHDVLVVQGPFGEVLIPCVDEDIEDVYDEKGGPIRTHVVDGLIDVEGGEGSCS